MPTSNVRQLLENGVPIYPITDKSLVIGLQDVPFESYVVAWDGASTPVVANIPAGVVVNYSGTDYTGTLAAGSATAPYLYLVASTSQQGEYDRYIVTNNGSAFVWTALGSTAPVSPVIADDLVTNDSSKALSAKQGKILGEEVGELEAKVDGMVIPVIETGHYIKLSGGVGTAVPQTSVGNPAWSYRKAAVSPGNTVIVNGTGGGDPRLWAFVDSNDIILSVANASAHAENLLLTVPGNAAYVIINDNTNSESYYILAGSAKEQIVGLYDEIEQIKKEPDTKISLSLIGQNGVETIVELVPGRDYRLWLINTWSVSSTTGNKFVVSTSAIKNGTYTEEYTYGHDAGLPEYIDFRATNVYYKFWARGNNGENANLVLEDLTSLEGKSRGISGANITTFSELVKRAYVTYSGGKRSPLSTANPPYTSAANLAFVSLDATTIKKNISLCGFSFTPSTSDQTTYVRIIFFDASDNYLGHKESINYRGRINYDISEIPAGASECCLVVPMAHINEILVCIDDLEYKLDKDIDALGKELKNEQIHYQGIIPTELFGYVPGKYVTKDGNNKKVINTVANQLCYVSINPQTIKQNISLKGFTYTPGIGNIGVYTTIVFFDVNDNYLDSRSTINYEDRINYDVSDIPFGATQCYINFPYSHREELIVLVDDLAYITKKDVDYITDEAFNSPDVITANKAVSEILLPQFKKTIRNLSTGVAETKQPLILLHFSDIHGIVANLQRIVEYFTHYGTYIDDVIHTGDSVPSHFNDYDFAGFWAGNGGDDFLQVIGNHDIAHMIEGEATDWYRYVNLPAYERYIAPYVLGWGDVHQPENASTDGKCYYYKDYSDNNIRLIVIDDYNAANDADSVQFSWFADTLASARTSGLSVVVAAHQPNVLSPIDCAFNTYNAPANTDIGRRENFVLMIDSFISAGGKFVCWLTGHTHKDLFGKVAGATNPQLNICISTAAYLNQPLFDYIERKVNTKSMDLFNIVRIDTVNGLVSLYRVGADFDCNGKNIVTMCYDYVNEVIVSNL